MEINKEVGGPVQIPHKIHLALVDLIRNHTPQIKYDLTHINNLNNATTPSTSTTTTEPVEPESTTSTSTSTSTTSSSDHESNSKQCELDDQRAQDAERVAAALTEASRLFVAHVHRNEFDRIGTEVSDAATAAVILAMRRAEIDHGWNHVCWREATVVSLLLVAVGRIGEGRLIEALEALDTALMLDDQIDDLARALVKVVDGTIASTTNQVPEHLNQDDRLVMITNVLPTTQPHIPTITRPIERQERPDFAAFRKGYYRTATPLVITGEMHEWPAMSKWCDMRYLLLNHGHRTVPIELGTHHIGDWRESKSTLRSFIIDYIVPSIAATSATAIDASEGDATVPQVQVAYLAQHGLVRQIPILRKDFRVPRYCGKAGATNINTWFGTAHTVTPLHYDSYDNFLSQITGFKYVRLYAPDQTPKLYVADATGDATKAQNNISQVQVEKVDVEAFPLFHDAEYTETILGPGEMLFIPSGYWHYVRSLSPSFSLNFWF